MFFDFTTCLKKLPVAIRAHAMNGGYLGGRCATEMMDTSIPVICSNGR